MLAIGLQTDEDGGVGQVFGMFFSRVYLTTGFILESEINI